MTSSPPATKQDVEEIVGRVVGEIVGDALQLIANQFGAMNKKMDDRFAVVDKRFDEMDKRFDRVEDKLDANIASVDHHTIDIRELQRKIA